MCCPGEKPNRGHGNLSAVPVEILSERTTGVVAVFFLLLLKGYQYGISPLFPPCCRYVPTCSEYAVEAITRYGAVRGIRLAVCRILRCHPFASGGYDPVK